MIRKLKSKHNHQGFTMIEVIAVLVIMGILAVVAAVKMSNTSDYDLASQVEVVKNHLRYAQIRAMNTDSIWGINFTSATTYYLFQGTGSTTPVIIPGEENATVNLVSKKTKLTVTPPAGGRITFDQYGSPGAATITINTNGGTITLTQNTGFIP